MIKTTKHEYHAPYVQPIYLVEYKGRKFKIQKRELPSTEWDLLEYLPENFDDVGDYEDYHWQETYPSKKHCLHGVMCLVNHNATW